jgi:bifunctional non-homologous end joining protein LigD
MTKKKLIEVEGRELVVSNLDKIYFPDNGFTKGQVIDYYSEIAAVLLPHLRDRPLTMKRYPDGIGGEHFYEKNAPTHTPPWVQRFPVARSDGGSPVNQILCNNLPTLVWVSNLGDIEKHVLLAKVPELNRPTSIIFDLDPGKPAGILDCAEVALHLRGLLEALNLQCFVKVSGSKGLHLAVPLNTEVAYEATQPFARALAELTARELPKKVVAEMATNLRAGKVFIDWSQNSDFKTTVCVYALRAKRASPFVSVPITWEELARAVKRREEKALFFTPAEALKRVKKLGDLYQPVLEVQQALPDSFTNALAAGPAPKLVQWQRHRPGDKDLKEYAARRDHRRTPEPKAQAGPNADARIGVHRFVVQKHAARHLHYDLRLEMQGVLRSWAVPKGPPYKPKEARLAMHVEDHPLAYADFEGTIPAGNYGAGTVMIWDRGEYEDLTGNPTAAFYDGKMHLILHGEKLQGEWILLKDKREGEGSNEWLLIKAGEQLVLPVEEEDRSVSTGRSMEEIARAAGPEIKPRSENPAIDARAKPSRLAPQYIEPMRCKPVGKLADDGKWSFEIKFDGFRCLAVKFGGKVTLYSRQEKNFTTRFSRIAEALRQVPGDFTLDGEIVALDEEGRPSLQRLQNNISRRQPTFLYAFDLLNLDGRDLSKQPIERRRELLAKLLSGAADPIRLSPLLPGSVEEIVEAVQKLGLEGVVGKRRGSAYEPGERGGAWIKFHTNRQQEFVVGGYVPGTRSFDYLLIGVYDGDRLNYVGKVASGFVPRVRAEIFPALKKIAREACPFANLPETKARGGADAMTREKMKKCRWVEPVLVCQVAFTAWTDSGSLRRPVFIALRDDKEAAEVVRET